MNKETPNSIIRWAKERRRKALALACELSCRGFSENWQKAYEVKKNYDDVHGNGRFETNKQLLCPRHL
jgi:hypothetical protein